MKSTEIGLVVLLVMVALSGHPFIALGIFLLLHVEIFND